VSGTTTVITADPKRRWIDQVAVGPNGALAWSAGKTAFVRSNRGGEQSLDVPSTVGALAFLPKGLRLAIAHYGGGPPGVPRAPAEPPRRRGESAPPPPPPGRGGRFPGTPHPAATPDRRRRTPPTGDRAAGHTGSG